MNSIKPIETIYNGYRFRSRLEARWAVLLDALGAQWEYEPEGFDLGNGLKYLPDFVVNNVCIKRGEPQKVYIEVKGNMTEQDFEKICSFSAIGGGGIPVNPILVVGEIPISKSAYGEHALYILENAFERYHPGFYDINVKWHPHSDKISILHYNFATIDGDDNGGDGYPGTIGAGKSGNPIIFGEDYLEYIDNEKTLTAYNKARQARFEHGEHGVI